MKSSRIKVSELIEILKLYPQDITVVAEWDQGWSNLDRHSLQEDDDGVKVVEFDVSMYNTYEYPDQ